MQQKKISPLVRWWVTPNLPVEDILAKHNFLSKWITHPIKRRLARQYLKLLQNLTEIKVIGITGSAGKTTTKEMLVSILKLDGKTVYTPKNIDSVYSIPNTILSTPLSTKYLVLEMGVEYPSEMDFYLWMARPDVGVITNIFPTHTEFMGNVDGVFKEKGKLVTTLSNGGTAVLNSIDSRLRSLSGKLDAKIVWFNSDDDPLIQNSLAASAVAKVLGIDPKKIKSGIEKYVRPPHRLEFIKHKSGALILDDSYNSNPGAALATLHYFDKIAKGKKIAVLGDMLELGKYDEQAHRELGREIAKSHFEVVVGVGKSAKFLIDEVNKKSKKTKTYLFSSTESATQKVKSLVQKNVSILIKGSRSIGLDRIIAKLS